MLKISILQKVILLFTILYIGYISAINVFTLPKIDNTVQNLEKKLAKEVLDKIVTLSKSVDKDLETYKTNALNIYKKELQYNTNIVWNYIDAKYKQIGFNGTSEELKNEVIEMVKKLQVSESYFYLMDYNHILLSHPYSQGMDTSNNKAIDGELAMVNMLKVAREHGEGFYEFWYSKYYPKGKVFKKLNFNKDYPKWNMVVGTGILINIIDENIQKRKDELFSQIKEIVNNTKIGKTGYIYIFDNTGKILIHPNDKLMLKQFKHELAYKNLITAGNGSKELIYKMDKPNDKGNYIYEKIAWIEYIAELKWYVTTSAYLDEMEESSLELQKSVIYLGIIVLVIAIVLSIVFSRKFLQPIYILSKMAKSVTTGDYSVRSNIKSNDELEQLSNDFNKMVETIEDHIYNLDEKVREKTIELEKLAVTDKLTGLNNRVLLDKELADSYKSYIRYKNIYSIILIDIDFFKKVNDTYGHKIGDDVLKRVSSLMLEKIRSTDTIGRWGGEEFLIISQNTNINGACQLADNLRKIISTTPFESVGEVTISVGVAQINSDIDEDTIIIKADEALYRAKDNGRNRVEI
jgi:diguanylate cyclase (GGDEF)-like protein